jgi:hypothetical protein
VEIGQVVEVLHVGARAAQAHVIKEPEGADVRQHLGLAASAPGHHQDGSRHPRPDLGERA